MTKDPATQEFMMILQFANQGDLRHVLSNNFNSMLWKDKIKLLVHLTTDLKYLHGLGSVIIIKIFIVEIYYEIRVHFMFQILDYLDHQMNKNLMIKYMEYYHILLQKY